MEVIFIEERGPRPIQLEHTHMRGFCNPEYQTQNKEANPRNSKLKKIHAKIKKKNSLSKLRELTSSKTDGR